MTSVVEVCNIALSRLGQKRINAIDEDTNEARECNLHYYNLRDRELEGFDWHHTISRQVLAAVTNDRSKEWKYAYQAPALMSSFIGVFSATVGPIDPPHRYLLEGSTIYCDVYQASGLFTGTATDPASWSALTRNAISWGLAEELAMPLTETESRAERARQKFQQEMSRAQAHDLRVRKEMQTYTVVTPALLSRLGLSNDGWVRLADAVTS